MSTPDKAAIARAAIHAGRNSSTQITEVIEAVEGSKYVLSDRLAAAGAIFFVGGACYFGMWFLLAFKIGGADSSGEMTGIMLWFGWRIPVVLTLATAIGAFFLPAPLNAYLAS
ncbi:MAG TPA: hypothetical protein VGT42_04305 [Gammaproteobacteria bacterium]|nr:hypothetical protein [Gammaproteobacteria bacterium]